MTTVTPHLGLSSNLSFKATRAMEKMFSRMGGQSGKDLFYMDHTEDLLFRMATDYEQFLHPLSKFHQRIAYVNVFNTDFQVSTSTAGFFSKKSAYPHSIIMNDKFKGVDKEPSFVLGTIYTASSEKELKAKVPSCNEEFCNGRKRNRN